MVNNYCAIESTVVSLHHASFGTVETSICTGQDFGYHWKVSHPVQKVQLMSQCSGTLQYDYL